MGCVDAILLLCGLAVRMENSVLGNALEGVPEESEGEEQPTDSKIESADNLDGKYQMFLVLVFLKREPKSSFVCSIALIQSVTFNFAAICFPLIYVEDVNKLSNFYFNIHSGAEKTRDELRKHVYDAMAEKPKEDMQESDCGSVNIDKERGNGDAQSPEKIVNGPNHEDEVTEMKSPGPPVDEVGESAGKETTMKEGESPFQIEEKDVKSTKEDEEAEGSKIYKC